MLVGSGKPASFWPESVMETWKEHALPVALCSLAVSRDGCQGQEGPHRQDETLSPGGHRCPVGLLPCQVTRLGMQEMLLLRNCHLSFPGPLSTLWQRGSLSQLEPQRTGEMSKSGSNSSSHSPQGLYQFMITPIASAKF